MRHSHSNPVLLRKCGARFYRARFKIYRGAKLPAYWRAKPEMIVN